MIDPLGGRFVDGGTMEFGFTDAGFFNRVISSRSNWNTY